MGLSLGKSKTHTQQKELDMINRILLPNFLRLGLFLLIPFVCGCSTFAPVQAYPGDKKPDAETALLDTPYWSPVMYVAGVNLIAVDDKRLDPVFAPEKVVVLPGSHTFVFRIDLQIPANLHGNRFIHTSDDLAADHVYKATLSDGYKAMDIVDSHANKLPVTTKLLHASPKPFHFNTPDEFDAI